MSKIEKRILASKLSLRAAPGTNSPGKIEGYAAVFNSWSEDLGGFKEQLLPGSFDRVLRTKPDVRCLMNHDPDLVLGRTKSGTLQLSADSQGLWYSCELPNTSTGRDLYELIKREDITQCSFSFSLEEGDDSWENRGGSLMMRTIRNVSHLYDVSSVTVPAYSDTSVSARNRVVLPSQPLWEPSDFPEPAPLSHSELRQRAEQQGRQFAKEKYESEVADFVNNRPRHTRDEHE
jgi:uncharacterized protein